MSKIKTLIVVALFVIAGTIIANNKRIQEVPANNKGTIGHFSKPHIQIAKGWHFSGL